MGGPGSGGNNRLSDAEKRRRGTFRPDKSEAVYAENDAKVVAGPWLPSIPEPSLPLNEHGLVKYNELARSLFDQNKLTHVTQMCAEQAAMLWQEQFRRLAAGEKVPASLSTQLQRALGNLKIAEDAPTLHNPEGRVNKFASCGFSNRRDAKVRLRPPRAAGA